jgi:hypothetical protein
MEAMRSDKTVTLHGNAKKKRESGRNNMRWGSGMGKLKMGHWLLLNQQWSEWVWTRGE